jgi:hypothetical protein
MNETMADLEYLLDQVKNSREFVLGSRLRQSTVLRIFRHIRFRKKLVRVQTMDRADAHSSGSKVCLLGIWYEDHPFGMPLVFLERDLRKWRFESEPASPFGESMINTQPDTICVYSSHENLRLDFLMDPMSGKVKVEAGNRIKVIDLYSSVEKVASVYPNIGQIETFIEHSPLEEQVADSSVNKLSSIANKREEFSKADQDWLEKQYSNPQPLALNNPAWRGILSSSKELFDNIYLLPGGLVGDQVDYYSRLLLEAKPPSLTFQGFSHSYFNLVKILHSTYPQMPIYVIYHGNFLQMREDFEWHIFKLILELYESGIFRKIGFVKKGMAEVMQKSGVNAAFIMNMVRRIPERVSQPGTEGRKVGIWSELDWNWRKPPYAMLAALSLIQNASGHVYNVSPRAKKLGEILKIQAEYVTKAIPQEDVLTAMADMHLNLYITLSECAPMLPLESLSVGSPCLFGPTSHYFLDNDYLFNRLIVPNPDKAEVIAEKANLVLGEREQVIEAYRAYAPGYNQQARQALADFLEFPLSPVD